MLKSLQTILTSYCTNYNSNTSKCIISMLVATLGPSTITLIEGMPSRNLPSSVAKRNSSFPASIKSLSSLSCHHLPMNFSKHVKEVFEILEIPIVDNISPRPDAPLPALIAPQHLDKLTSKCLFPFGSSNLVLVQK